MPIRLGSFLIEAASISSHTFAVATPAESLATVVGATNWDGFMRNACGACHAADRYGL